MVYAILREQLGNQLFIWAAGFSLARRWNCELRLITTNYGRTGTYMFLRRFPVGATFLSPLPGLLTRFIIGKELHAVQKYQCVVGDWRRETESTFEQSAFARLGRLSPRCTLLDGMFQSWRYFLEHQDAIRGELAVTGSQMTGYCDRGMLTRVRECESVSVHVRRTDYVHGENAGKFVVCTKNYYDRCLEICRQTLRKPVFFVFSDDIGWARSQLSGCDLEFVSTIEYRSRNIADFVLMANCRHHVIANSTFSWWAAFAGDGAGMVLTPSRWFNDGTAPLEDKILPAWVVVSVDDQLITKPF